MENIRIVLGLSKRADSNLETFAFSIITAMTGNADFLQPTTPTLDQLTADTNDFKDALAASASRNRVSVMIKNQKRQVLEATIKKMADYVALSGDPIKVTGAGFALAYGRSIKMLGAANGLDVKVGGNAGEAIIQVGRVDNALSYFVEYAISPAQGAQRVHSVTNQGRVTLSGLKSLTAYDFIGGAVGTRGQVVYTEVITKTVL